MRKLKIEAISLKYICDNSIKTATASEELILIINEI